MNLKNIVKNGKNFVSLNRKQISNAILRETTNEMKKQKTGLSFRDRLKSFENVAVKVAGNVARNHAANAVHTVISSTPISRIAGITASSIVDHTLDKTVVSDLLTKITKREDLPQQISDVTYRIAHGRERGDITGKYFITEAVCGVVIATLFSLLKKKNSFPACRVDKKLASSNHILYK